MNVKTWDAGFTALARGLFFGAINASRTVPEGADNRAILTRILTETDNVSVTLPYQTHSNICHYVSEFSDDKEGDALVTDIAYLPIGVLTADCAPVLFYGAKADGSPVVGAAHAGARGAVRGILASTLQVMRERGAVDIRAAIGPTIHKESYEVGTDFQDELIGEDHLSYAFFEALGGDKFLFDLPAYVKSLLEREGVPYTFIDVNTYVSPDCFSYRRATHKNESSYGRELSAIVITG